MAAVMYYGIDDKLPLILESFFVSRKQDAGEAHSLVRISDPKKMSEALVGIAFDIIYIEQSALDKTPLEWVSDFRKKFPRFKNPLILTGDERDPAKIMKLIEAGYADYMVNPPDRPLTLEKFVVYSTGKRNNELRQVFSLKLSQATDIAKPAYLEELSEFDCKVRTQSMIATNELAILYAESFSESGTVKGSILGRCYECLEHQGFKGQFLANFYFVGPTPDVLTHIRNALRKTYVASKSKG